MLALALALALQTAPEPGPTGRVLFTRQLDRRDDLFVLHLPQGRVERLTDHRAKDSHGEPSPDGRRVVFNSERAGWWKIWTLELEGRSATQLTRPASGADSHPCWSPDGTAIAFVEGSNGAGEIVRLSLADGARANLTRNPARDHFPAWRPGGGRIAFSSDRDGAWSLYAMDEDGANVVRLTESGEAIEPAWFPDGRALAFRAVDEEPGSRIGVLDLGGATRVLTDSGHADEHPCVSPDGAWIVFESDRAGGSQLFAVRATGGDVIQLTREGYCYAASWFAASDD